MKERSQKPRVMDPYWCWTSYSSAGGNWANSFWPLRTTHQRQRGNWEITGAPLASSEILEWGGEGRGWRDPSDVDRPPRFRRQRECTRDILPQETRAAHNYLDQSVYRHHKYSCFPRTFREECKDPDILSSTTRTIASASTPPANRAGHTR